MPESASESTHTPERGARASAWTPLRHRLFRGLWFATIASNIGTWMHDVGAAWLMTSLAPSPLMVALVQSATTLPVVLLALPAGALADIVDRRRYLIATQLWMLLTAALLSAFTLAGQTTAGSLLIFTFLLGCGTAMSMPAWSAITPELVPKADLQAAVTVNSLGINISRAIGPAIAGMIIAATGPAAVFLLNALSFLGVLFVLTRWRREPHISNLPAERLVGAMRAGLRYAWHSRPLQAVLIRSGGFVLFASALWALLPLLVKKELASGAGIYGALLACVGAGAVINAFFLPRWRNKLSSDRLVAAATIVYALVMLSVAQLRNVYLLGGAMCVGGAAWISVLSSLQIAAQQALPAWVRARGISLSMTVFMGGMAGGSLLWGQTANLVGIPLALSVAAICALVAAMGTWPFRIGAHEGIDFTPSMHWPTPLVEQELTLDQGPIMVSVEYFVNANNINVFQRLMNDMRRMRQRDGAYYWELFTDTADVNRYVEVFMVESWLEHLRQHERVTVADREFQQRIKDCLSTDTSRSVHHYVAVRLRD